MSSLRLFADFGSTFTKLVAFDMEKEELAARVQSPSTVESDVMTGLRSAFELMAKEVPISEQDMRNTVACSSAAGGLRMICIGLVPEYTTQAGRLAALGAGAKVVGEYSYELSKFEMKEICAICPDIILLTGGTDGGNSKVIIHNAEMLAAYPECAGHIVVAGNKKAAEPIKEVFEGTGMRVYYADNVMPVLGKLSLDSVNELIRSIFISNIVQAKGISRANTLISSVIMPTPSAVFDAARLLSIGVPGAEDGFGELVLVDVGGATTDVCSIAEGRPTQDGVELTGIEEPFAKRTVEGDLGLYHNLDTLAVIAHDNTDGLSEREKEAVELLKKTRSIPTNESRDDQLLYTSIAVKTAVERHAGVLITELTPRGISFRQRGKDLSEVRTVIGSGGPVAYSEDPLFVLSGAAADEIHPDILKPKEPLFYIDREYILFAIGLLSHEDPAAAIRIARKYLVKI